MTKYAKKKKHLILAMRIRMLIGYVVIGLCTLLTVYKADVSGKSIFIAITIGLAVLFILIYLFGIMYCNYPNPLCYKTVEGRVADSAAYQEIVLGYLDMPESLDVYGYKIEYAYNSKRYTKLVKLPKRMPTGKRPIIKICPFIPFLIHLSFME